MKSPFRVFIAAISGVSALFASLYLFDFVVGGVLEHFTHIVHTVPYWVETVTVMGFSAVATPILVYHALKRRDIKRIRMPKPIFLIIVSFATFLTIMVFTWFLPTHALRWSMSYIFICLNFVYFSTIVLASLYYLLKNLAIPHDN